MSNTIKLLAAALFLLSTACGSLPKSESKRDQDNKESSDELETAEAKKAKGGKSNGNQQGGKTEENVITGSCLCGGCPDGTTSAAPLALAATEQTFRVTLTFSQPVASLDAYSLSATIGGELKEPKIMEGPCAGIQHYDGLTLFNFKAGSDGIQHEVKRDARGITGVTVTIKQTAAAGFYESLKSVQASGALLISEESAEAGVMQDRVVVDGSIDVKDAAPAELVLNIAIDTSSLAGSANDKK